MGKGSNSTQSTASGTTNTSPAGPAYTAYLNALNMGAQAASAPYVPYSGEEVAPVNAQETAGIGTINSGAGAVQAAGAPLSQAAIQQYMSPYTQNVVNATQAEFNNQNAQQQSQVMGNAAAQGALGGDRVGVAQALTAEQQQLAQAPVIAGLQNAGYTQAVSTAEQQQGFGLQAAQAAEAAGQPQVAAGQLQQQTQQAADTQAMTDYFQQQGYPLQMAQYYAGLVTGVGSQLGGTSTTNQSGTTQGPTPNTFAQIAGLGLAGAAAFAKSASGGRITARRAGGRIAGFAAGGVPGDPYAQSWVPSEGMTAGSGAPSAPQISFPSLPSQGQNQSSNPAGGAFGLNQSQLQKGFSNIGSGISNGLENTSAFGTGTQDYLDDLADSPADAGSIGDYDRGGRVAGFASGGAPFSQYPSWVPSAQIQHGKGAPSPPSVSFPKAPAQQGLSASQLGDAGKGLGVLATKGSSAFSNYLNPAPQTVGEDNLAAIHYRGGRVKRYATGGSPRGYADGSDVEFADPSNTTFDDRFDAAFPNYTRKVPTSAGFGASSPAYDYDDPTKDQGPFNMGVNPDQADQEWRGRTDRDQGRVIRGVAANQNAPAPTPVPPPADNIMVASKQPDYVPPSLITRGTSAPQEDEEQPSDVTALAQPDRGLSAPPASGTSAGVGSAPPPSSDTSSGGLFGHGGLLGTGIQMTPELRQGLLQAGLSMMATTRGGPGSFLGAAGEGGMAGVGAYEKSLQLAQEQAEKERQDAMRERELADREANQSLVKGPNGQYGINKPLLEFEKQKSEFNQKDNWSVLQGDGVTTPDRLFNKTTGEFKDVPPGKGQAALNAVQNGQFDYRAGGPTLNKGDAVPEPIAVAGRSPDALKKDAETYLTNGQLPKASASPRTQAGVAQQQYARAVQNYGVALAESKGLTMTQLADLQRFGVNAARFPLSRQGDQTVAIGTAIRHISALEDYADAWDKAKGNVNAPIVREAAARFSKFLGKAEPTNLEQAASIAGPEIIKAIGVAGGGTGGERVAQEEGFRPGASTQQIHGAAGVARTFLAGQLPAKEAQARNVGFPHERFMDMVGPTEYDYLSAINHGKPAESGATNAAPKPTLQEFLAKAKPANPNSSDADLTTYYNKKYGGQ